MTLIVHAGPAIGVRVERVLHHLGVVAGERHDGRGVRGVVDNLPEGVRKEELVIVRKALVHLNDEAVVDGIGAALEFRYTRKTCKRTRLRNLIHGSGLCRISESDHGRCFRALQVDVEGAGEMGSFDPEIIQLNGHGWLDLVFQAKVGLLHVGLTIIRLEDEDGWNAGSAAGWRGTGGHGDGGAALGIGILRNVRARESQSLDVHGIVGEGGANGNGGSAAKENAVARAENKLVADGHPCKAKAWAEISMIAIDLVGVHYCSSEAGTRD